MKFLKAPLLAIIALAALGLIFNFGLNAYFQLILLFAAVNCLMSMSLNLVNGYTGQFSLGHAGFMALGAYFSAYANTHWDLLPESVQAVEYFIYALGGGLLAAFAGLLVGLPSLRLKGDYLAIVTLGFGEIIRVALLNMDFLGGPRGYSGIPGFGSFLFSFIFASVWLVICFFTIWRIMHSTYGRGFLSVREDEIAAEAMGINTTSMKVRAFVLSSFFAGVAGSLFAHFTNFINPSSFTFLQSVNAVIMVVLGGMGSMTGSIVAAIFITVLPEALRPLQDLTGVDLRMVIYSLSLILVMILRPQGLFGDLELSDMWRKYVRRSS
ncbi:branched-chain amino acid ABC transporter permease [Bdellovibrio sp.]|uniref:branched-chain amino acid ABC transporter permease n=1 Tax=Bdellovibrio sp. TaxID=28201 RepID=UPI0039E70B53